MKADALPKRFVLWTIVLAVALVAGVAALNLWIDPYNRFGHNFLGVYISAERESKATDVLRYPHDALLMGNSKAAMIPASQLRPFRFYNAAFGGASVEEIYFFLKRFAHHQKLVLLSADLGQCSLPSGKPDPFAPPGWLATLDMLCSLKTAEYSVRTISSHLAGEPPAQLPDGSFHSQRWFELYDRDNSAARDWQLKEFKRGLDAYQMPPAGGMDYYQKIRDLLRSRGIACVVFIPPLHEVLAKHLRSAPSQKQYQAWKNVLERLFPSVVDLSLSSYTEAHNFFRSDPVHFKPEVGARMLNEEVIPVAVAWLATNQVSSTSSGRHSP